MWGESNETTELAVGLAFLVVCALVLCWANRRSGLPVISDEEHDRAVLLELGLEPVALLNTGATSRVLSTRVIPGPEQSRKRSMSIQNSDGASGRVDDHELVCVKLIMREPVAGGLTAADVKTSFESELGILQTLAHADAGQTQAGTTLQLVGSFESDWCYIILSRLAQGGDLFQLMAAQLAHFSELSVARVAENMAQAVHRCHSLNIAHRDIKPENFVFQDTVTDPTFAEPTLLPGGGKSVGLQLIDFGESVVRIDAEEVVPDFPGTLNYAAPEVITRGFDMTVERWKAADMWSLGVVVYILLHGKFPFKGKTNKDIYRAIKAGKYALSPTLSAEAADFLEQLLQQESLARMSVDEALRHPFLVGCWNRTEAKALPADVMEGYKQLHDLQKLQRSLRKALSNCMSEGDYTVLRALERKDVDSHTGVLSFLRTLLLGEQNEAKMDLDQLLSAKPGSRETRVFSNFEEGQHKFTSALTPLEIQEAFDSLAEDRGGVYEDWIAKLRTDRPERGTTHSKPATSASTASPKVSLTASPDLRRGPHKRFGAPLQEYSSPAMRASRSHSEHGPRDKKPQSSRGRREHVSMRLLDDDYLAGDVA